MAMGVVTFQADLSDRQEGRITVRPYLLASAAILAGFAALPMAPALAQAPAPSAPAQAQTPAPAPSTIPAPGATPSPQIPLRDAPTSFAPLARQLLPAVVNVQTTTTLQARGPNRPDAPEVPQAPPGSPFEEFFRDFLERNRPGGQRPNQPPRRAQSLGSGFIISKDGYILTNNHVVGNASRVVVALQDGTEMPARVVGTDDLTDLALLRIESKETLRSVPWGSSGKLRVGQWVLAAGNPFGLGGTVTSGIVSARGREIGAGPFDDFIQTDAAINPGNSGGPLLDSAGRLIGINTAIYSPSGASAGIGFAVPVDTVMRVVPQLIKTGKYIRPALGIEVDEQLNQHLLALAGSKGVFVLRVTPGSAAHKAGLAGVEVTPQGIVPGDRIIGVDGKATDDVAKLLARLDDRKVGDVVVLSVERAGKSREVQVELQPGI